MRIFVHSRDSGHLRKDKYRPRNNEQVSAACMSGKLQINNQLLSSKNTGGPVLKRAIDWLSSLVYSQSNKYFAARYIRQNSERV